MPRKRRRRGLFPVGSKRRKAVRVYSRGVAISAAAVPGLLVIKHGGGMLRTYRTLREGRKRT